MSEVTREELKKQQHCLVLAISLLQSQEHLCTALSLG